MLPDSPQSSLQQIQCDRAGEGCWAGADCRCTERDSQRERKGDWRKLERDQEAACRQTQVIIHLRKDAVTVVKVLDGSCLFLHQVLHQGERWPDPPTEAAFREEHCPESDGGEVQQSARGYLSFTVFQRICFLFSSQYFLWTCFSNVFQMPLFFNDLPLLFLNINGFKCLCDTVLFKNAFSSQLESFITLKLTRHFVAPPPCLPQCTHHFCQTYEHQMQEVRCISYFKLFPHPRLSHFLWKIFFVGKSSLCPVQSQQPLRESQEALLKKLEELTEQLKQERERALALEGQLTTATLSLQTQDKVSISAFIVQFRLCLLNHPFHILFVCFISVTREDCRPGRGERFNKRQLRHFTRKVRGPSIYSI